MEATSALIAQLRLCRVCLTESFSTMYLKQKKDAIVAVNLWSSMYTNKKQGTNWIITWDTAFEVCPHALRDALNAEYS